jgi:hypothetical protein
MNIELLCCTVKMLNDSHLIVAVKFFISVQDFPTPTSAINRVHHQIVNGSSQEFCWWVGR